MDVHASAQYRVIGTPQPRVEDQRHLNATARFVADIECPDCREVAFLRSPMAFGRLREIMLPAWLDADCVWTAERIEPLAKPIEARLLRKEFNQAPLPLLARDRVRYVGELLAAVSADTRAQAEDLVESLRPDIEPLPAVMDAWEELSNPSTTLHEGLASNVVMRIGRTVGDSDCFADAKLRTLTRRFSMGRILASPLEGRGCVTYLDSKSGELVVYASHQRPHLLRSFLAEQLHGISESDIRVIVPDVGGGFGGKSNFYPEELILAAMTLATGKPHRWTEDRYEHFVGSNHSRQHEHEIKAYFDDSGRIHAIQAKVVVDSGAYSSKTSTGAIEANMATNVMLGPYAITNYKFEAISVFTNKTPVGPFRGVGRPAGCFAMERIVDEVAHELGMDPIDLRLKNIIRSDQFPYTTATGLYYDSGDYGEALRKARAYADEHWLPLRNDDGRYREGIGYAIYVEQAAHGSIEWERRGSPLVYGHEAARATLSPDGSLMLDVGTLGHGQGHETSLAQVAAEVTGLPVDCIRVRQGDTARAPYGMGSVASRSMVMAGGAVAAACRQIADKALRISAAVLDCEESAIRREGSAFIAPSGKSLDYSEIANIALIQLHRLPKHIKPGMSEEGLYRPEVETGTFSYGVHAVHVRVDILTGVVKIKAYAVVEDCGTVVNPMIVDGQVRGGVAQGIGQALYEELRYSGDGQPLSVTFGEYTVPSSMEVPRIEIIHMNTPSPFSEFGMKGMGEGGAVGPPAAIANAVSNALRPWGLSVDRVPIRPDDLLQGIIESGGRE